MNSTYISNNQDAEVFVRQLLNIGEAMYRAGGDISNIEEYLHSLGKAYGASHVNVNAVTSSIAITAEFGDVFSITQNRRITKRGSIDCTKLDKLNQLCTQCAENPIEVSQLKASVLEILSEKPSMKKVYLGELIGATMFTLFFGGNLKDIVVACFGVFVIVLMQKYVKQYCSAELFFNVMVSLATGVCINLINLVVPGLHVNQILIGDIMVLIPGIAITNSIRYILSEDIISSLEKLLDSLMQAFGIAAGFMLSLMLIKGNIVNPVQDSELLTMVSQLAGATFGTLGFCIIFNLRKKHLVVATIGGLVCWIAFLLLRGMGAGEFSSVLVASIIAGIYGEICSGAMKVSNTIFFIPTCVPLIPGRNLYYSALAIISQDWEYFRANIVLLILYAVGIASGLAIVSEFTKFFAKLTKRFTNTVN